MSNVRHQTRSGKETIHSGHFMVSHFEAEAQDEFDDLAVPVPDEEQNVQRASVVTTYPLPGAPAPLIRSDQLEIQHQQLLSIETSLTKLFRCMTLAYRQKLTSPKWNRFKGIKLRWKDKIRLNNVIWRCWHMQFIKKQNTLVCQFASPLDVDTHVKPETTILEGKYWKRRAEAVIAEYKKWRMFHITRLLGRTDSSLQDTISEMDTVESFSACSDLAGTMLTDEDYLNFMSDTLFSTITNHQPFAFPDPREIARGASLADFIQPSLGPLQPNLDDFMDTLEPLHDILSPRLPPVPEECALSADDHLYRSGAAAAAAAAHHANYSQTYAGAGTSTNSAAAHNNMPTSHGNTSNAMMSSMQDQRVKNEQHMQIYDNNRIFVPTELHANMTQEVTSYSQNVTEPLQGNIYGGKSTRLQYVNAPKIVTQQDAAASNYSKYSSVIPPSQSAPETVSLLQQPHGSKYSPLVVVGGRSQAKAARGRIQHYAQPYAQLPQQQLQALPYDSRQSSSSSSQRQSSPQMQYLQPGPSKQTLAPATSRTFKMPSPPLAPASQQALQQASTSRVINPPSTKEAYRSSSLPLGAQLNPDWSISAPAPETDTSRNTSRTREQSTPAVGAGVGAAAAAAAGAAQRVRSRSSSGGGGGGGAESRRPPPLTSVASEPTLQHSSVMLAHLLTHQHQHHHQHQSQSSYKSGGSAEDVSAPGSSAERNVSPQRRAPTEPQADLLSSRLSGGGSPLGSPPASPGSPRRPHSHTHAHMHAEQKRRYNIKNGFDTLQALIPHLNANPAAKVSKAAMLQKGAEYIKQLKSERNQIKEEMESLRQQIECLNNSIANCHSLLPATGAPVSRARSGRLREMFARHVANRTMQNWKYWLFSVVAGALLESFAACVSSGSGADLVRSTLLWAEQHCSLVEMRPAVLNSLRVLCTTTDILTNPERLPEEARTAVATTSSVKSEPS